jgi:hypothetical protein
VGSALLIGAALGIAGCGGSSSTGAKSSSQAGGHNYDLPSSVHAVKIASDVATVRVTASHGASKIHVVERSIGDASSGHNVAGSTAAVTSHCPEGITFSDCHMDYQLTMPANIALDVNGAAGEVVLQGGPTNAHIHTTAGEVSGTGLGGGSYTISADAGKVDLAFTSAPTLVKVTTGAGEINVTVPANASYRVKASSDFGDDDVKVPNDGSARNVIELHADAGSISLHTG